jgi:hypothetical protein
MLVFLVGMEIPADLEFSISKMDYSLNLTVKLYMLFVEIQLSKLLVEFLLEAVPIL